MNDQPKYGAGPNAAASARPALIWLSQRLEISRMVYLKNVLI